MRIVSAKAKSRYWFYRHAPFCYQCRPDRLVPYTLGWAAFMLMLILMGSATK